LNGDLETSFNICIIAIVSRAQEVWQRTSELALRKGLQGAVLRGKGSGASSLVQPNTDVSFLIAILGDSEQELWDNLTACITLEEVGPAVA
jgi:hypothetical protein